MSRTPPRDPKSLLVEMDARNKARDVREQEKLKAEIEVRWWEPGLLAVLFVGGLGTLVTIFKLAPTEPTRMLGGFVVLWGGLLLLGLLTAVELLLRKVRAMRRLQRELQRQLDEQQETLRAVRNYLEAIDEHLHPRDR